MGSITYEVKYNKINSTILRLMEDGFFDEIKVLNRYDDFVEINVRNDCLFNKLLNYMR